jgi:hypothetical protein
MSIQTLKKKGIITCHGTKVSGKAPGGFWLNQGPFGSLGVVGAAGMEGFSVNGGRRNRSYIGKSYCFSRMGTPYYGQFPIGWGGSSGRYPKSEPLLNVPRVLGDVEGRQYKYVKPSVLSTRGMLEKKYRWAYNGAYPNFWVQPVYPNGSLSDNASQQVYIDQLAAANITVNDTNRPQVYVDNIRHCRGARRKGLAVGDQAQSGTDGTLVSNCDPLKVRMRTYDDIAGQGAYTKTLRIPQTSAQYTLQVQRKCSNPVGAQKPFPFATSTPGISNVGGSAHAGPPPAILTPVYTSPPAWYIASGTKNNNC